MSRSEKETKTTFAVFVIAIATSSAGLLPFYNPLS